MLSWGWPWLVVLLPLPWLLRICLAPKPAQDDALWVPFMADLQSTAATGTQQSWWRWMLAGTVWVLLVVSLCRPQELVERVDVPRSGRSMILVLDVSASMRQTDLGTVAASGIAPTRLDIVKHAAKTFIDARGGDRVGLMLFGSHAYVYCPLTFDLRTVTRMVDEIRAGVAGELTALGDAIGIGVKRLRSRPAHERVLILLTDGAPTAGVLVPEQAARLAKAHGIRVHTIGVGAQREDGRSSLDEAGLAALANSTGGRYFRAVSADALRNIYAELDRIEPTVQEDRQLTAAIELYPWTLGAALGFAALALLCHWLAPYMGRPARA